MGLGPYPVSRLEKCVGPRSHWNYPVSMPFEICWRSSESFHRAGQDKGGKGVVLGLEGGV